MGNSVKCPQCGAGITSEGKFCTFCGCRIPDDVKRIEIKKEVRVEDVAEIKRAEYEEKESMQRVKQMKRENTAHKVRIISLAVMFVAGLVLFFLQRVYPKNVFLALIHIPALGMCILAPILWIVLLFRKK